MDKGHEEIARTMMAAIACDNGANNCTEQLGEYGNQPLKHVQALAEKAGLFFDKYPELLTDEVLDDLTTGEEGENEEKYGRLEGFKELDSALKDYFDSL